MNYVYLLSSGKNGTLYPGVTNDLIARVAEHKSKTNEGFSEKYSADQLVWFDYSEDIRVVIKTEKQIKRWNRKWKIREIVKTNPDWKGLFYEIGGTNEMLDDDYELR